MRYLVRVENRGRRASRDSIAEMKETLSGTGLPRHENFRVSNVAVEFDLYEDSADRLDGDLRAVTSSLGRILSVRNLSEAEEPRTLEGSVELAKEMYREERFWEVHEELESQWRRFPRGTPEKEVLQGLILLAAAYVHLQKGEGEVAVSILRRASQRLEAFGSGSYRGLDIGSLRRSLEAMEGDGVARIVELPLVV